jgi:hypothetical protein
MSRMVVLAVVVEQIKAQAALLYLGKDLQGVRVPQPMVVVVVVGQVR